MRDFSGFSPETVMTPSPRPRRPQGINGFEVAQTCNLLASISIASLPDDFPTTPASAEARANAERWPLQALRSSRLCGFLWLQVLLSAFATLHLTCAAASVDETKLPLPA